MNASKSRTILVTGCSSGIGRHCARRLREEGWRVFATARDPADIETLTAAGFETHYLDYADETSIGSAFASVCDRTGGTLDALFNNGAYAQPGAVEDVPTHALRAQFEANLFGWHALTRLAVPVMRRQGHGRIVHCSSILGVVPYRWRGAYVASKFALEGLFNSQRLELRGSGIHMSQIEPGPIRSRIGENGLIQLKKNIDMANSVHSQAYAAYMERLADQQRPNLFRRSPEAVYRRLRHALNARKPRASYPVTIPTWFMFAARRLLPGTAVDWLVTRSD